MRIATSFAILLFLAGCVRASRQALYPPPAPREFRAAWVATVDNIDWPSTPGLPAAQQQRQIIAMLDKAKALNLNAIILQVRTSCDALYPSPYEPWSYYLTGAQGKPPEPFYDPLQMWIDESHKRGIELHAWFNPYRAKQKKPAALNEDYQRSASHISNTQPNLVKTYGSVLWLDPGEPAAADHTLRVMLDVTRRYDIDGIHIDDYFYPYQEKDPAGKLIDFPDEPSWQRYQKSGGKLSRPDWRRENINQFVRRMYAQTKQLKPWVKVGISPFGIWRPGNPPVVKGFDAYESIYADSRLWLHEGWVDYFTPQLYWKITAPAQPFEALLKWWVGENRHARHLWPGMHTSRITASATQPSTKPATKPATTTASSWAPSDIVDQIQMTRRTPGATGHVHFSMVTLLQDRQHVDEALNPLYSEPALAPASPWLASHQPAQPQFRALAHLGVIDVTWQPRSAEAPWLWVVYVKVGETWHAHIYPSAERHAIFKDDAALGKVSAISVSAVDRLGNESKKAKAVVVP